MKKYTGSLTLESLLAFVTSNAEGASLTETENKVREEGGYFMGLVKRVDTSWGS